MQATAAYLNTAGTEDRTGSSRPDAAVTRRRTREGVPFATTDDVDFERERLPDWTTRYALNRLEEEDLVDFRYSFHDVRRQVYLLVNYSRIRNRLHSRSHAVVRSYVSRVSNPTRATLPGARHGCADEPRTISTRFGRASGSRRLLVAGAAG